MELVDAQTGNANGNEIQISDADAGMNQVPGQPLRLPDRRPCHQCITGHAVVFFEVSDLVRQLVCYRQYQRKVPMLIPSLTRRLESEQNPCP